MEKAVITVSFYKINVRSSGRIVCASPNATENDINAKIVIYQDKDLALVIASCDLFNPQADLMRGSTWHAASHQSRDQFLTQGSKG